MKYDLNREWPDDNDKAQCREALTRDLKRPVEPNLKKRVEQQTRLFEGMGLLDALARRKDSDRE